MISSAAKLEVASLAVNVKAIAAVFVEAPLDTVLEAIVIVTAVESYVHVYVLEAAELVFPVASLNLSAATVKLGVPSLVAVQVAV